MVDMHYIVAALVFSLIGLAIFAIAFLLLEVLTPKVAVWKELVEKQNVALAIFLNYYNNFTTIDVEPARTLKG